MGKTLKDREAGVVSDHTRERQDRTRDRIADFGSGDSGRSKRADDRKLATKLLTAIPAGVELLSMFTPEGAAILSAVGADGAHLFRLGHQVMTGEDDRVARAIERASLKGNKFALREVRDSMRERKEEEWQAWQQEQAIIARNGGARYGAPESDQKGANLAFEFGDVLRASRLDPRLEEAAMQEYIAALARQTDEHGRINVGRVLVYNRNGGISVDVPAGSYTPEQLTYEFARDITDSKKKAEQITGIVADYRVRSAQDAAPKLDQLVQAVYRVNALASEQPVNEARLQEAAVQSGVLLNEMKSPDGQIYFLHETTKTAFTDFDGKYKKVEIARTGLSEDALIKHIGQELGYPDAVYETIRANIATRTATAGKPAPDLISAVSQMNGIITAVGNAQFARDQAAGQAAVNQSVDAYLDVTDKLPRKGDKIVSDGITVDLNGKKVAIPAKEYTSAELHTAIAVGLQGETNAPGMVALLTRREGERAAARAQAPAATAAPQTTTGQPPANGQPTSLKPSERTSSVEPPDTPIQQASYAPAAGVTAANLGFGAQAMFQPEYTESQLQQFSMTKQQQQQFGKTDAQNLSRQGMANKGLELLAQKDAAFAGLDFAHMGDGTVNTLSQEAVKKFEQTYMAGMTDKDGNPIKADGIADPLMLKKLGEVLASQGLIQSGSAPAEGTGVTPTAGAGQKPPAGKTMTVA